MPYNVCEVHYWTSSSWSLSSAVLKYRVKAISTPSNDISDPLACFEELVTCYGKTSAIELEHGKGYHVETVSVNRWNEEGIDMVYVRSVKWSMVRGDWQRPLYTIGPTFS